MHSCGEAQGHLGRVPRLPRIRHLYLDPVEAMLRPFLIQIASCRLSWVWLDGSLRVAGDTRIRLESHMASTKIGSLGHDLGRPYVGQIRGDLETFGLRGNTLIGGASNLPETKRGRRPNKFNGDMQVLFHRDSQIATGFSGSERWTTMLPIWGKSPASLPT